VGLANDYEITRRNAAVRSRNTRYLSLSRLFSHNITPALMAMTQTARSTRSS